MKLKLSCWLLIIEIMSGRKMAKPNHQKTRYQLSNLAVTV